MSTPPGFAAVFAELEQAGLLMLADARLPSVTTLVAGEPVRGSWWGHAAGEAIYAVSVALDAHADVTSLKLVAGKVTFVHRGLWLALVGVGSACAAWQLSSLSRSARGLLARVDARGHLRADRPGAAGKAERSAAKELEERLLVHARAVHTERGSHAKELESWSAWRRRVALRGRKSTPERARAEIEAAVARWGAPARLPWD